MCVWAGVWRGAGVDEGFTSVMQFSVYLITYREGCMYHVFRGQGCGVERGWTGDSPCGRLH